MIAALLDTETTGVENAEIIEMAYADVSTNLTTYGPPVVSRFAPSKQTTYGALAVHHIVPEDLVGCRPSVEAVMPVGLQYLIGHNIDFDWGVLGKPPVKRICTLACCRTLWPECDAHSLTAMMYYLERPTKETRDRLRSAPSADTDVTNNLLILSHIVAKTGCTSLESLWKFSEEARIPKIMTFGKHKGKTIAEVDNSYAAWYARQENPDGYLIKAFIKAGKMKGRN